MLNYAPRSLKIESRRVVLVRITCIAQLVSNRFTLTTHQRTTVQYSMLSLYT